MSDFPPLQGVFSLAWRLTGLLHPRWSLDLGPGLEAPVRAEAEEGWELVSLVVEPGEDLPSGTAVSRLERCHLEGIRSNDRQVAWMERCRAEGSTWSGGHWREAFLCDLSDAQLHEVSVKCATACSFRGATIRGGSLDRLVLCDLSGARLQGVRIGRAAGVDFTDAVLENCDLAGADLGGAVLRRVRFVDTDPTSARMAGADLRGARGIEAATRRHLLLAGARFRGAGWFRFLLRFGPRADPLRLHRQAAWAQRGLFALGALLCVAALVRVLWPPPVRPVPEVPEPRRREATAREVEQTQQNLSRFRQALSRAHDRMVERGGDAGDWPAIVDVQQNRYDIDGSGSGTETAPLVAGGLPENYLTDSTGTVLPYCNEVPTQDTLSGVDADWHYCERSGRLFASAGYTGLPTLDW